MKATGRRVAKLVSWATLSQFGNTPIAKFVAVSPIVAQAIIYSNSYITKYFGFYNLYWLYWSLLIIAIGQIIYFVMCPQIIKHFGEKKSDYIERELNTISSEEFQAKFAAYVRSHFRRWNPSAALEFLPKEASLTKEIVDRYLKQISIPGTGGETLKQTMRVIAFYQHIKPGSITTFNDDAFKNLVSHFHGADLNELEPTVQRIRLMLCGNVSERQWMIDALTWHYDETNQKRLSARFLIATFYFSGSLYFLYHTASTILLVANKTLHLPLPS